MPQIANALSPKYIFFFFYPGQGDNFSPKKKKKTTTLCLRQLVRLHISLEPSFSSSP